MNAQLKPETPGRIVFDEPAESYHLRQLDVANNGGLTVIDEQSPAHYFHWINNPANEEETATLSFGRALHCATLEPDVFAATYSVLPADAPKDLRRFRDSKKQADETKRSIAWWDEWEARNVGKQMMKYADMERATAMAASVRSHPIAFGSTRITVAELIDDCQTEVTLRWQDEETGIWCKARADLWSPDLGFAMDLKSTRDASPKAFARSVFSYRYHVQHCHYADGFRVCGQPLKSFIFLPVEQLVPHVPATYHIDAHAEERGWEIRQRSMAKLAACLKSGEWPGYTTTIETLALPAFAFYD